MTRRPCSWTKSDAVLIEQNNAPAWLDCEGHGLRHRPGTVTHVGDALYTQCARCPVSIRSIDPTVAMLRELRRAPSSFTSDYQEAI